MNATIARRSSDGVLSARAGGISLRVLSKGNGAMNGSMWLIALAFATGRADAVEKPPATPEMTAR